MLKVDGTKFIKANLQFVQQFAKLVAEKKVRDSDFLILTMVASNGWYSRPDKRFHPCMLSIKNMAEVLGKSHDTVERSVKRLRDAGLLKFVYRVKRGNQIKETSSYTIGQTKACHFKLKTKNFGVNV